MHDNAVTAARKVVDSVSQGVASPRILDNAVSTTEPVTLSAAAQSGPAVTFERVVPRLVSNLLAAVGFAPHAVNTPLAPAETPALWTLLAAARREFERSSNPARSSISAQPSVVTAAAVVTTPTTLPSKEVGWVTGPGITDGFNIGGTDLGIIWENGLTGKIQLAFGDTFSDTNMSQGWRSNVLLLSTDTKLYNGLDLLQTGPAYQFIPSAPQRAGPTWLRSDRDPDFGGVGQQRAVRQLHVGQVVGQPGPVDHQLLRDLDVRPEHRYVGAGPVDDPLGGLVAVLHAVPAG